MPAFRMKSMPALMPAALALGIAFAGCQSNPAPDSAAQAPAGTPPATAPAPPAATGEAAKPGPAAPDFTLPTVSGDTFRLSERLDRGPVLVSFFNPL